MRWKIAEKGLRICERVMSIESLSVRARKFFIKAVLLPVGFVLCMVGVILPWRARNVYLDVLVGPACGIILRSEAFVSFFIDVGFETEHHSKSR